MGSGEKNNQCLSCKNGSMIKEGKCIENNSSDDSIDGGDKIKEENKYLR